MKVLKPKFWEKKNSLLSLLLLPFSLLFQFIYLIKKRLSSQHSFQIPLKNLNYWNVELQEAYFSPLEVNQRYKKLKNKD